METLYIRTLQTEYKLSFNFLASLINGNISLPKLLKLTQVRTGVRIFVGCIVF